MAQHGETVLTRGSPTSITSQLWYGEAIHARRRPPSRPGAPRVAFVHGLEGTWDSWTGTADRWATECDAYFLDLPWRAGGSYAWQHWGSSSTWLARALDLLPAPPDVLVAHSFGASTALDLLAREDRPLRAAVLIAPLFRPRDEAVNPAFFTEAVTRFRAVMSDGVLAQLGGRAGGMTPDLLGRMLDKVLSRAEPSGFLQLYTLLSRLPALPLEAIGTPVLIVNGEHDPSAPPPAARELARRLPAGRLAQRPEFGHFCQLDHAAEVTALIAGFLADVHSHAAPEGGSDS
ncbi:hypothetical protein Ade02nite_13330 [Paractinoplanes deccanensis]|uniref:Serine aminopeptidase S33 domain-containing protein n=1 Tax=Paractinoplanes deccanensis TaxID=113561 RepID=A0ABQ3XY68_9ACTN|nr:alpha/beta hydrolase [Actinoplanes deccanensis]GID72692.1 hypothetical protein Ade02nite_13330 [Actinoplanes deccanensis]